MIGFSVSDEIIKVIDALCSKIGIAMDWTSDNVVTYLQDLMYRYMQYKISLACIYITVAIVVSLICIFASIAAHRCKDFGVMEAFGSDEAVKLIIYIITFFIVLIAIIMVAYNLAMIFQCKYIPEKVFIHDITDMYKNMK